MKSIVGILGTISEAGSRIRWNRREDCRVSINGDMGRKYQADVADGILTAIVSHDSVSETLKLWHVSVSHHDRNGHPDRCPNWDELKSAAYRLIQEDIPLVLIFPRRSTPKDGYVDLATTCLHLWQSTDPNIDRE